MGKTQIGIILIIVSSILLLMGLFRKKNNFIDLRSVLISHFKMFRCAKIQFFVIYICTLVMSIGISLIYIADITLYQNIIVVMSIFVSMLMAMLSLIKAKDYSHLNETQRENVKEVIKEVDNQVVYCSFVSVVVIVFSLIMIAISKIDNPMLDIITSTIVYYLVEVLLLNILLIMKRMSRLL